MMFAIASLTQRPISPVSRSEKPTEAASASMDLRTGARWAGSLVIFSSSRPGMVMGRVLTCAITDAPIGYIFDPQPEETFAANESGLPMGLIVQPLLPLHHCLVPLRGILIITIPKRLPG